MQNRNTATSARRRMYWLTALVLLCIAPPSDGAPLLPDLVPIADPERNFIYGGDFDTSSEPGRVLFRFDALLANLGDGPFEVFETTDSQTQIQDVYQHIYDSGGGFTSTLMGSFLIQDPPPFGHLNLESLALYNLRHVEPGNGVGDVVASFAKTSHAVVDSTAINRSLPGAPANRVYDSISANPLGVSVGYGDLYGRNIPTQRIDITGIAPAQYWLEVVVDPLGYVQETDETNNTARILVDLSLMPTGAATVPGDYDQSGTVGQSDLNLVLLNWGRDVNDTGIPNDWVNDRPSGVIGQAELNGALLNWGNTSEPGSTMLSLPEPFGLSLILGLCFVTQRRDSCASH